MALRVLFPFGPGCPPPPPAKNVLHKGKGQPSPTRLHNDMSLKPEFGFSVPKFNAFIHHVRRQSEEKVIIDVLSSQ